ncbi:hypothetical protein [Mycoplasmopsis agassizii]|uniref:Gcp-like domain-containing protein n=1 Tax=Mycoplasmopsis agassizii TaxID=33922 RepID=A0ABX4H6C2_9BACT|nr:hypothetical protein [Mycoplasmopsis agassizii]PAF55447.1 hypothetical protein CJF60_02055 [Mycoplasmopsis agassizii]SMC18463.1 Glycoprotease family protein [Mycoplasmopsis agassizii]
MILLVDTTNKDLLIALFDSSYKLIKKIHFKNLKQKVETLDQSFKNILNEFNFKITDLKELYIAKGPGLFTGVRIALVYFQTFSLFHNFKIFTSDSFIFLDGEKLLIDAKGNKYFYKENIDDLDIKIGSENIEHFPEFNYDKIIDNFSKYKGKFILEKDNSNIKEIYLKDPQIGKAKW